MKMLSLTVYDETHSCTLLLPDNVGQSNFNLVSFDASTLVPRQSVLVLRNACTILDSSNRLILTMASPKYSSLQIYNSNNRRARDEDIDEDTVIAGFCEDKSDADLVEVLMRNISSIPLKQ